MVLGIKFMLAIHNLRWALLMMRIPQSYFHILNIVSMFHLNPLVNFIFKAI